MKCVVSACLEDYHLFKARRDMSSIVFYFFLSPQFEDFHSVIAKVYFLLLGCIVLIENIFYDFITFNCISHAIKRKKSKYYNSKHTLVMHPEVLGMDMFKYK